MGHTLNQQNVLKEHSHADGDTERKLVMYTKLLYIFPQSK